MTRPRRPPGRERASFRERARALCYFFFRAPLRWDLANRWPRAKRPLPELLSPLSYILALRPCSRAPGANAFDLALINNHYCAGRPWSGVPYAGYRGRSPGGSRGRENRIDDVVSIIAPDKGMGSRGLRGSARTYARIGLIAPR